MDIVKFPSLEIIHLHHVGFTIGLNWPCANAVWWGAAGCIQTPPNEGCPMCIAEEVLVMGGGMYAVMTATA